MTVFDDLESAVRSYCRTWPVVFDRAKGSVIYDEHGRGYLDFFAGAGALNYGHNEPRLKAALLNYLSRDGVVHSLDMFTAAKRDFLEALDELILAPRDLHYRVQFPGPGGANAVEAALKLARKVTGRTGILSFTNGFHGMTLGALAVTGNSQARRGAGVPLPYTTVLPYDRALGGEQDDFAWLEKLLGDPSSGVEQPAAVIVESVQGEGGVNVARTAWLHGLAERCVAHEILLILDDVQAGCGRTGPFFSFESAGIKPDFVCLSKSLSGYGLPLSVTLIREELDCWEPGEHSGTFRGVDPALVTATVALRTYWENDTLERRTTALGDRLDAWLRALAQRFPETVAEPRGRGLIRGLPFVGPERAARVSAAAFERGLLVETAGAEDEVIKLLPPLTIEESELERGVAILAEAISATEPGGSPAA